ncbi:unnamed protein product [Cylindrotheca closterium]|uniref:Guanylate cyclase domain-containing protein n=1 Tax=Cylindrotheca closterium TaxID=2856 RepID=A0AAD2CXC6_9STRA|nr:unnamed protein product [Cylindrotheca closterium]
MSQAVEDKLQHTHELDSSHDGTESDGGGGSSLVQQKREEIANRESKLVFWLRFLLLFVVVASAVAIVTFVYLFLTKAEEEEFTEKFHSDSTKVVEALGKTMDQTVGTTDAFIRQIVSFARHDANSSWPFVTKPDFALNAGKVLKLTKSFTCAITVFVEPEQHDDWLKYSFEHMDWVEEAKQIQEKDEEWHKPTDFENTINYGLWGFEGAGRTNATKPTEYMNNYLPYWQQYPMVADQKDGISVINHDVWSAPSTASFVKDAVDNQRVVITPPNNIYDDQADDLAIYIAGVIVNWAREYVSDDVDVTEPIGGIWIPMYDYLDSFRLNIAKDEKPVGLYYSAFFWRDMISDILPIGSEGLVVVFSDTCGPSFTYQLDGPEPIYLGAGDLHDSSYDYMGMTLSLNDIMDASQNQTTEGGRKRSSQYTGLPLSETFCPRSIHIYPSKTMEDNHVTSSPLIFTIAAAAIFVFTSSVFLLYDCVVSRRQRIVMQRALASGAIVSSLFPEKVKQQLYEEQKQEQKKQVVQKENAFSAFANGTAASTQSSKPIAELFHETTVMFADLAGFTSWSSVREPAEVFELLETLYGSFDKIALRRRVFKVETIGDCYLAVTGIPEPQANHAAIMVKFAHECMVKMDQLTIELADKLGEETRDLKMRVGIHSGSTTAGVLRGEKGRFQLFGDTVNTAARMETNGVKGRIHVSQATADALIASGKGSWLTKREGGITAKGKGEMQTYFVQRIGGTIKSGNTSDTGINTNEKASSDNDSPLDSEGNKMIPTGK